MPASRRNISPTSIHSTSTVMSTGTPPTPSPTTPEDFAPYLDSDLAKLDLIQAMSEGGSQAGPFGQSFLHLPPHLDQSLLEMPNAAQTKLAQPVAALSGPADRRAVASPASLDPNLPQRGLTRRGRPRKVFRYLQGLGTLLQASGSLQPPAKPSSSRGRNASQERRAGNSKRPSSEDGQDSADACSRDGETGEVSGSVKKKARKVTKACLFCKRSHMTCDEERPCRRCVRRGIGGMCVDEEPATAGDHAGHSHSRSHSHSHADSPALHSSPSVGKGKQKAPVKVALAKRERTKSSPKSRPMRHLAPTQQQPPRRFSAPTAMADDGSMNTCHPQLSHTMGLGIGGMMTPSPVTVMALEAHTLASSQQPHGSHPHMHQMPPTSFSGDMTHPHQPGPSMWGPSGLPAVQQGHGMSHLENFLNDLRHAEMMTPSEGVEVPQGGFPVSQPQYTQSTPHLQTPSNQASVPQHHARSMTATSSVDGSFTPSGMPSLMVSNFDNVAPVATVGNHMPPVLTTPSSDMGCHQAFGPRPFNPSHPPSLHDNAIAGTLVDLSPRTNFPGMGLESLERLKMWVHAPAQAANWSPSMRHRLISAAEELRHVLSNRFEEAAGGGRGRGPASNEASARLVAAQGQLFSRIVDHYRSNILESLPLPMLVMKGLSILWTANSHFERAFGLNVDDAPGGPMVLHEICSAEVAVHLYEKYLDAMRGSSHSGPITVVGNVLCRRPTTGGHTNKGGTPTAPSSWMRSVISIHIIVDHNSLPNALIATVTPLDGLSQVDMAPHAGPDAPLDVNVPLSATF